MERLLVRVLLVRRAVEECDLYVDHRVAAKQTFTHRAAHTGLDRLCERAWDHAALGAVFEDESGASGRGSDLDDDVRVLAWTATLTDVAQLALLRLRQCRAIRDAGRTCRDMHAMLLC